MSTSWHARIQNQMLDVLNPEAAQYREVHPTEALTLSLEEQPSSTLVALTELAQLGEMSALRTLSLVLLRRYIVRTAPDHEATQIWDIIPVATQKRVQDGLLACLASPREDQSDEERNNICKTASYVAEVNKERGHGWPELETCVLQLLSPGAPSSDHQLFYKFVFEYPMLLADTDTSEVVASMRYGLAKRSDADRALVVQAIKASVALLETDDRATAFSELVPAILDVFPRLVAAQEQVLLSNALYAFLEIFDAPEVESSLLPHLGEFLPFIRHLLSPATGSDADVKKSCLEVLASSAEMAPSSVRDLFATEFGLCTRTLLEMMAVIAGDATDPKFWDADVDDVGADDDECHIVAEDTLDRIVQAIGGQAVLPTAFSMIPEMLRPESGWKQRYAALSAIGTLAEGCVEEYQKDAQSIVQLVLPALADDSPRVVYAAVYSIAELCTYLGGTIQADYGEAILPTFLSILSNRELPARLLAYTCAALVNYTEELSPLPESLSKISNALFSQLLTIIDTYSFRDDLKMRAMSALAQLAATLGDSQSLSSDVYRAAMSTLWRFIDGGEVEDDLRARSIDCATLLASSVDKASAAGDSNRLITSLLHIQQTHTEDDDPCKAQVLVSLSRMAEVMGEAFLPFTDAIVPILIRQASILAEKSTDTGMNDSDTIDENESQADPDEWLYTTDSAGHGVKVHTESLREKEKALQLLTSLAHSLGPGLTKAGSSETTTGEWTSYAESMLELATNMLSYEHSSEIRSAAASMLPPLLRGIKDSTTQYESLVGRLSSSISQPLLSALAYEPEVEPLSAMFSATSEILLAMPELFSPSDAESFVIACRDQIEELRRSAAETRQENPDDLEFNLRNAKYTLEYMSSALRTFIQVTGTAFPVNVLFDVLNKAIRGQLELLGEKGWALRLVSDLIEFASPAALAWTASFLPYVGEGLESEEAGIRHTCSYIAGMAALNEEGLYTSFSQACLPALRRALQAGCPSPAESAEIDAFDNVVSAVGKIVSRDTSGRVDHVNILPAWIRALPIRQDTDEMEPCYTLLLDLIVREHPAVSPTDRDTCVSVLNTLSTALAHPGLPKGLIEPLRVGLRAYLLRSPPEVQQEWERRVAAA